MGMSALLVGREDLSSVLPFDCEYSVCQNFAEAMDILSAMEFDLVVVDSLDSDASVFLERVRELALSWDLKRDRYIGVIKETSLRVSHMYCSCSEVIVSAPYSSEKMSFVFVELTRLSLVKISERFAVLNEGVLRDRFSEDFEESLLSFCSDSCGVLEIISKGASQDIRKDLHKLKGLSGIIAADRLNFVSEKLELLVKGGEDIGEMVPFLISVGNETLKEIERIV